MGSTGSYMARRWSRCSFMAGNYGPGGQLERFCEERLGQCKATPVTLGLETRGARTCCDVARSSPKYADLWFLALTAWLLLTVSAPAWRQAFHWISRGRYFTGLQANRLAPGATGLFAVLLVGLPLPLMFLVDGETLDSPEAVGTRILNELGLRHLDVQSAVLLAKPVPPETIADLRSTDFAKRVAAQRSIERVNLRGRGLREPN